MHYFSTKNTYFYHEKYISMLYEVINLLLTYGVFVAYNGCVSEYNLFISHSWSYSDQYKGLVKLLEQYAGFLYKNYSVPKWERCSALFYGYCIEYYMVFSD